MEKKKRSGIPAAIIVIILLLAGLGVWMYPTVSDLMNRYQQNKVITDYTDKTAGMDLEKAEAMLAEAEEYNRRLPANAGEVILTEEELEEYEALLDVTGTGIMGYIEIPKIEIHLPICHGTNEETLQQAVGHVEGFSLPVGGAGTHTVISGHSGLPSAKLFTDIDKLETGDRFRIRVLNRELTYEVDEIRTVLPEEMFAMEILPEQDYCTLVTCTPYGINTHRLLVRGTRVPNDENGAEAATGLKIGPGMIIPLIAAPAVLLVIILLVIAAARKKRKADSKAE